MFLDAVHGCVSCMMFTMVEVPEPPQSVRNVSTGMLLVQRVKYSLGGEFLVAVSNMVFLHDTGTGIRNTNWP